MNAIIDRPQAIVTIKAASTDDPAQILDFAELWFREGTVALATLVEIRGGASKPLGSQMAVAENGQFCGYVSGGCVEAAVASEAILAMEENRDRTVMFGDGSPFFDIVLPCGGGITVAIHVVRETTALRNVRKLLERRQEAALRYRPSAQSLNLADPLVQSRWLERDFVTLFRPCTRLVISGQSLEAEAVANLGAAAGYDIVQFRPEESRSSIDHIDAYTAVVLLHHDLDRETPVLTQALSSRAFYIGALGSTRTHQKRIERLQAMDHDRKDIDRIRAPIGLFGPARDATSLAVSVMADVAAARSVAYP